MPCEKFVNSRIVLAHVPCWPTWKHYTIHQPSYSLCTCTQTPAHISVVDAYSGKSERVWSFAMLTVRQQETLARGTEFWDFFDRFIYITDAHKQSPNACVCVWQMAFQYLQNSRKYALFSCTNSKLIEHTFLFVRHLPFRWLCDPPQSHISVMMWRGWV